jgi:hypothetical protein
MTLLECALLEACTSMLGDNNAPDVEQLIPTITTDSQDILIWPTLDSIHVSIGQMFPLDATK